MEKAEIVKLIEKTQKELVRLQAEKTTGKLKNVNLLGQKRGDLARLKTILREKELNEDL